MIETKLQACQVFFWREEASPKVFICLSIFVSSANITTQCGQEPQAGW